MEQRLKRALARLLEAHVDLKSAQLLRGKVESRSLFHSQQCVEKALKACLSTKYVGDIMVHEVAEVFKKEILSDTDDTIKKRFLEILTKIKWIEKRWIDTRYEVERGAKIEIPSMIFKTKDAIEGIDIAERTLEFSRKFLEGYFKTRIPESAEELEEMMKNEL